MEIIHLFVAILLIFLIICLVYYLYSRILLDGFSRKLYESYMFKLDALKDEEIFEEAKDLAKMNIQTLHSFLVMVIALVALIFSLYNLLKPANSGTTASGISPYNDLQILSLVILLICFISIIIIINFRWYKVYIKLINLKAPEITENFNIGKKSLL